MFKQEGNNTEAEKGASFGSNSAVPVNASRAAKKSDAGVPVNPTNDPKMHILSGLEWTASSVKTEDTELADKLSQSFSSAVDHKYYLEDFDVYKRS